MPRLLPALLAALALTASSSRAGDAVSLLKQIDEGFVQVFEKVAPAVVVIEALKKADEDDERDEFRGFDFFFKDGEEPEKDGKSKLRDRRPNLRLPQQTRSEGSGFIIRADGYILTNYHVVAEAEKLEVHLKDGRTFTAKVTGSDDKTDIAVLKIDARDLPVAELGDSEKLRVGQLVCAIGAPFNQQYSFTCGWVSGKGRTNLLGPSSTPILYEDYIQTDAFINPGNSGGPLFDVEGHVVGMNTLINGIGRGLAFAIPSNMLRDVSTQLISTGKVQRPYLGISMDTVTEPASGVEKGVIVLTIFANAPAMKSDLRHDDIITEVDGVKLNNARQLQQEILKKKIGQTVQLTVWRSGATLKIPVTTEPADFTKIANQRSRKPTLDARPDPLNGTAGLELKDAMLAGAVVVAVAPESLAAKADVQRDDVIVEVDGKPMANAAAARAAISTWRVGEKKGVTLSIDRKGRRTVAELELPK